MKNIDQNIPEEKNKKCLEVILEDLVKKPYLQAQHWYPLV